MKDAKLQASITLTCPNGHRLRGDSRFIGKKVKCPRCQAGFVISAPAPSQVTDTGVMRILGDVTNPAPAPIESNEVSTRPCPRCGMGIGNDAPVCEHCKCYVGVMPRFMTDMLSDRQVGQG